MMKTSLILALSFAVLPCVAEPSAEPATPSTTERRPIDVELLTRLLQEELDHLRSVRDTATADAAPALLTERRKQITPLLNAADFESMQKADTLAGSWSEQWNAEVERLQWEGFYGSAALAEHFTDDPASAAPLQNFPAELLERAASQSLKRRDAHYDEQIRLIGGGPGFTQATAWVLPAPLPQPYDIDIVSACVGFLADVMYEAPLHSSNTVPVKDYVHKIFADGKPYVRLSIDSVGHTPAPVRYRLQQWCDVSALTPYRSTEQVGADIAATAACLPKLHTALQGVHDTASAEAAAPAIAAILSEYATTAKRLATWITEEEVERHHLKPSPELAALIQSLIQEHDFYHSAALKAAFENNL